MNGDTLARIRRPRCQAAFLDRRSKNERDELDRGRGRVRGRGREKTKTNRLSPAQRILWDSDSPI